MKWSYRKCCCVEQKKHSQLPLTVSRTEAVPFTFMTHGVVFSDQQHSSHGQTFNRCWCRLLEHRRAAWWAEIRLFAASLACIWCHCARKFNEILWWKAADKLLPIYFHLFMDLKSQVLLKSSLGFCQVDVLQSCSLSVTGKILILEDICCIWWSDFVPYLGH